jgi:hypothetical protein
MTFWMPLGLLALHLFVSTGRPKWAFALGLAIVAQLYSGMYYAVFFVLFASVIGAGLLVAQRPPLRPLVVPLAAAALIAALLAAPLVRAFTAAQQMKGERTIEEVALYSAVPFDYLRTSSRSATWKDTLPHGTYERALFPGAAPLALAAVGLVPPLGAMRLVYAAGLAATVDGSLGVNGVVYPYLYRWLPPVRGLRSPARFGALVGLVLAVLSGFGAWRLFSRIHGWPSRLVLVALTGAVLADAWPSLTLVPVWRQPPPLYESLQDQPGVVLAEFPVRSDPAFNAAFMYFSLWHWTPTVNGYSGFVPRSYQDMSQDLQDFPIGRSIAVLQEAGVTHVTVNCGLGWVGSEDCATIMARVRNTPQLRPVRQVEWEGAPAILYELSREAP